MKKLLWYLISLVNLLMVLGIVNGQTLPIAKTLPNSYTFTLSADMAHVSGGVYSSGILIRTLFSDSAFKAGPHTLQWDGLDDNGNLQTIGTTFQIRVLANNITYTWQGTIGNNSTNQTGPTKWGQFGSTQTDFTEADSAGIKFMYAFTYFSEYSSALTKFKESSPNKKVSILPSVKGIAGLFVCSDATKVYYAGWDYVHAYNWVIAINIVGDNIFHFPSGPNVTPTNGVAYTGVADLNSAGVTGQASGIAVQQSGNYLLIAHKAQNTIVTVNKLTGATVQTNSITAPTNITLKNDTSLWVSQGTTLTHYILNSDGTITPTTRQITGFSRIAGLRYSGNTFYILDAGNQQIPKFYNASTLASITKGTWVTGGYASSPTVADNKLYEEDLGGTYFTFITPQSDGSFWVGDSGNDRYQHYDSSGNYINNIMYLSTHYGASICLNNNTRVFSNFTEFTIDYTQPFGSCWTLTNNWRYNVAGWYNVNTPLGSVVTLTNGRTYGVVRNATSGVTYIAEFTSSGLRIPSTGTPVNGVTLDSLGNAYVRAGVSGSYPNQSALIRKYTITGFDGSNNPTYNAGATVQTLPLGARAGGPGSNNYNITTSGNYIAYMNTGNNAGVTNFFHLSGYNAGVRVWEALQETYRNYQGTMPTGLFDVGNLVNQPGSEAGVIGNNIIAGYHGEFWKNSETNMFWHYQADGLMLGQFGVLGPQVQNDVSPYGYAGNALSVKLTSYNGDIILLHSDEEHGSGLHWWTISNLASINEQFINLTLTNRVLSIPANQVNLLAGLANNVSISGQTGWNQFPAADYFNSGNDRFSTITRRLTSDFSQSPDVVVSGAHTVAGSIYYLERVLPPVTTVANWKVGGMVDFQVNSFNSFTTGSTGIYEIDILDNNHKVICKLIPYRDHTVNFNTANFGPYGGNEWIGAGNYGGTSEFAINRIGGTNNVHLSINLFGTDLSTTQAMFDNTANPGWPKYFRIQFNWASVPMGVQFGLLKLNYQ
jgi:hypothetical protein